MPVSTFMSARAAARSCVRSPAIAACSAPSVRCRVHPCSSHNRVVAPHDNLRTVSWSSFRTSVDLEHLPLNVELLSGLLSGSLPAVLTLIRALKATADAIEFRDLGTQAFSL